MTRDGGGVDAVAVGAEVLKAEAQARLPRDYTEEAAVWQLYDLSTETPQAYEEKAQAFYAAYRGFWREHSSLHPFPGGVVERNEIIVPRADGSAVWSPGCQLTFFDADGRTELYEEHMSCVLLLPLTIPLWGDSRVAADSRRQPSGSSVLPDDLLPDTTESELEAVGRATLRAQERAGRPRQFASDATIWHLHDPTTRTPDADAPTSEEFTSRYSGHTRENVSLHPFPGGVVERFELRVPLPDGSAAWSPGCRIT